MLKYIKGIRNTKKAQGQENYLTEKQIELLKKTKHNYLNEKINGHD